MSRRAQGIELTVFLLLIAPELFLSVVVRDHPKLAFSTAAIAVILRDIGFVALIFLFLARNGERREEIGLTSKKRTKYAFIALLTFPLALFGMGVLQVLSRDLGLSVERDLPSYMVLHARTDILFLVLLSAVNGIAEEIIFRGYLMLRLTTLTGRTCAVLLSSALFGVEHLYQGTASVVSIGFFGVFLALIYVQTRSLTIPIVWHCLQDLVAIGLASRAR